MVKPPPGHFKLHVDVGFDEANGCFSVGGMIRDHSEYLQAASTRGIRHPGSVLFVELTVFYGLLLAIQACFEHVLVFSDSSPCRLNSDLSIRES